MKRLNSSELLAEYTSQFVTVRIDTDNDEWRKLHQRYHDPKNNVIQIPMLYLIRSDEDQLYAGTAHMDIPAMGQLLHESLNKCGRSFTQPEISILQKMTDLVSKLNSAGDVAGAISKLNRTRKFGLPGEIRSFAEPAIKMNALAQEIFESGESKLAQIEERLAESGDLAKPEQQQLVQDFYDTNQTYSGLKSLKPRLNKLKKSIRAQAELRQLLSDIKSEKN